MDLIKYIKSNILLFDGAMGTMLLKEGLKRGENTEVFGFKNPDKLLKIHKLYLESGANVITTNTFGANEIRLNKLGYSVEEVIDEAIKVAKQAVEESDRTKPRFIALDIGPIGEMLEPIGKLSFEKAYEVFKTIAIQGQKSKVDLVILETMIDLCEAKAAVLAVKENTDLPVFCTMTFDEYGKSFTGSTPEEMIETLEGLGIDAIGVNCSVGPSQLVSIVKRIANISKTPIIVQSNAGLPKIIGNEAIYNIDEDEFFYGTKKFVELGASILGGCCGTTPQYISKISDNISILEKIRLKNSLLK